MGYAETGFELEVDLTSGNIEKSATGPRQRDLYLGGDGIAAAILRERVPPEVEPSSRKNLLIFSAGLLAATPVPGASRTCVSSIDPLSSRHVSANFEGFFAPELKHAGYDRIIVRGRSENLVYLLIHDDRVEIRDAAHLQGKSPLETAALIQREQKDSKVQVAAIGPAGENGVAQASIGHANSSASQGVGKIMGDKGLKAIAVRGTRDISIARPAELFALCNPLYGEIYDHPSCGDLFLDERDAAWQTAPLESGRVKGFRESDADWQVRVEREEISYQWENYSQELEEVREIIVEQSELVRGTGCYNCPRDCHRAVTLPGGRRYYLKSYARLASAMAAHDELPLNYEVLFALQEHGLDEAAMVELYAGVEKLIEAGILTGNDLPDYPAEGVGRFLYLVEKVSQRRGIGELLADGIGAAVARIGKGAGKHLPVVNDVQTTDASPAHADDILGICSLLSSARARLDCNPPYHLQNLSRLASLASGQELDSEGLLEICRRNRQLIREMDAERDERKRSKEAR
ncbi:aldehyde ferredoxin oxidoreductase N-terminal domain-containing protein [Geotalea sp. SG265]|uniref:aldehyde ferredoxin oxidoreductase N-terminal domain-containing protein n=1 Tax=Geotalea sp. SG265 TaxID=2922867 RepID=UPI001FAEA926|nr:aldehyde ferredoxin oxidoreductase N-terminal domain-containing protein [Geotalea sp. SG265]